MSILGMLEVKIFYEIDKDMLDKVGLELRIGVRCGVMVESSLWKYWSKLTMLE